MRKLATLFLAAAMVFAAVQATAEPHEPTNILCGLPQKDVETLWQVIHTAAMLRGSTRSKTQAINECLPEYINNTILPALREHSQKLRKERGLPEWKGESK